MRADADADGNQWMRVVMDWNEDDGSSADADAGTIRPRTRSTDWTLPYAISLRKLRRAMHFVQAKEISNTSSGVGSTPGRRKAESKEQASYRCKVLHSHQFQFQITGPPSEDVIRKAWERHLASVALYFGDCTELVFAIKKR
jgi:hypothetical protein